MVTFYSRDSFRSNGNFTLLSLAGRIILGPHFQSVLTAP